MSEMPLGNDAAARSPTGEILDARPAVTTTPTTPTETPKETPPSTVTPTDPKLPAGETLLTDKKDDVKSTPTAPESYTAFTVPAGHTLDAKMLETVTPIFKELGLTQDQAQKLVDLQVAREVESAKVPKATYDALRQEWRTAVTSDADIAGYSIEGKSGIDAVKIDIGRALATLDSKLAADFRSAMDLTGAGDNPAFVKAFWKLSQSVVEGRPVVGRAPSPAGQRAPGSRPGSTAQALYPNLPSAS